MKRIAKHSIAIKPGEYISPGSPIELTKAQAKELDLKGALEELADAGWSAASEVQKPKGAALAEALANAIKALTPVEDFTSDGKPSVAALGRELGYEVSAKERDDAWAASQAANNGQSGQGSAA